MLRPRIIPCLLIKNGELVKTQSFLNPTYVGDPINTVRIFNEKQCDELILFDIDASVSSRTPNFELIKVLASQCSMPLCYGGGVTSVEHARTLINMGVEKVAISSAAVANPKLLTEISDALGSQSVVGVIDVRKNSEGHLYEYEVTTHNAKRAYSINPLLLAKQFEDCGAGEIVINFVDRDGHMQGYDLEAALIFKQAIKIPITFLGGVGQHLDLENLFSKVGIAGAAVGSLFVFKGRHRAVLINYPSYDLKIKICDNVKINL
jgi:cyclase